MDSKDFDHLVRRAFSSGVTGKEAFQMELEAAADEQARRILEETEADDRNIGRLGDELEQPERWYRSRGLSMVASAVLAAGVTLLLTRAPSETAPDSVVSSAVYYLESTRSTSTQELPVINVDDEQQWITLLLYPAYDDFDELVVNVDRLTDAVPADLTTGEWTPVWESRAGTGNQDSLAVTLGRSTLSPGIYRITVFGSSPATGSSLPAARLHFRVSGPPDE